jgi:hypothetical protein
MVDASRFRAFRARCYNEIQGLAAAARRSLAPSVRMTDALPVADLVIGLRGLTAHCGTRLDVRSHQLEHLPPSVWAVTRFHGDNRYRAGFCHQAWRELHAGVPRSRFSAAHELAHICLHHEEIRAWGCLPHLLDDEGPTGHPHAWDTEVQANQFAGALLVPTSGLEELARDCSLTPAVVARRFGVSLLAAERRLAEWTN